LVKTASFLVLVVLITWNQVHTQLPSVHENYLQTGGITCAPLFVVLLASLGWSSRGTYMTAKKRKESGG
jgi:hypothetical protein